MKYVGVALLVVMLVVLIFFGGYCTGLRGSNSATRADVQDVSKNMADQMSGLHKRFDSIDAGLGGLDKRFNAVEADFDLLNKRFSSVDAKLDVILSVATNGVMRDVRKTRR